jgi:hypothetical protein
VSTYEEWRVTGTDEDGDLVGRGSSPRRARPRGRRSHVDRQLGRSLPGWTDGPHLHKRTVTVTEWTEVDA